MAVSERSPFKSKPRMTRPRFVQVLHDAGSPWAGKAGALYDLIAGNGHDPAIWLAIAGREHTFGTNTDSVLHRNDTNSWTNARTIRHPNVRGEIIIDAERRSHYVRYRSVEDSLRDGMYRVDDHDYVYYQRYGSDPTIEQVLSVWTESDAVAYVAYAVATVNEWYEETSVSAQISGFKWREADSNHYDRGRTQKIRGGAQHYTAGTNSLDWLTKTSNPPVSATFLVKHNPTLDDRGWQLVRIEDTAWTTAFANPYTVSIEYEHTGKGAIPDAAYDVLAQTWIDIAAYVKAHNLGEIPLNREGIKGHKEWVNNPQLTCPDGIDVDRIVRQIDALVKPEDGSGPPQLPKTVPDPWEKNNPWRKGIWIPEVFVDEIDESHDWIAFGYVLTPVFAEGDVLVQYFERARLELHRNGEVTRGLVGLEAMQARYPERTF